MICKYCGNKVNKIINYCGVCICMDCYSKMSYLGKPDAQEEHVTQLEHQKRLAWMHRETFLSDEDYHNYQKELETHENVGSNEN